MEDGLAVFHRFFGAGASRGTSDNSRAQRAANRNFKGKAKAKAAAATTSTAKATPAFTGTPDEMKKGLAEFAEFFQGTPAATTVQATEREHGSGPAAATERRLAAGSAGGSWVGANS